MADAMGLLFLFYRTKNPSRTQGFLKPSGEKTMMSPAAMGDTDQSSKASGLILEGQNEK